MTATVSFDRNAAVRRLVEDMGIDTTFRLPGDDTTYDLLRDVLGIVDHHGNLMPDDLREYELEVNEVMSSRRLGQQTEHLMTVRPAESTAPDALRNLPPVVVAEPKPKAARKPKAPRRLGPQHQKQPIRHATIGGYRAHLRRGEKACQPCKDAVAARKREERGPATRGPAKCGTHGGYKRHYRLQEPCCQPCRDARRAYERDLHARRGNTKAGE